MNAAHLRLVRPWSPPRRRTHFCGHCGKPPAILPGPRVCELCGLGLVLDADAALAPSPGDAFLVVDRALTVCALSGAAEAILRVSEVDAVHRHLAEFLVPADAGGSKHDLVALIIGATREAHDGEVAVVRPPSEYGVRYRVRIGACGPTQAALLVFDES
jgi:PAS domain-containing protein